MAEANSIFSTLNSGRYDFMEKKVCRKESISCLEALSRNGKTGESLKASEAFYASGEKDDKEPWEELCNRMLTCLRKYAEQYCDGNILMVSHGASINSVLSMFSDGKSGTGKILLKNACINILHYEEGTFSLGEYNLTSEKYLALKNNTGIIE